MKRLFNCIIPAFVFVIIFSCDEVDKIADITFNVTLMKTLPVSVVTTNEMTTTIVLDATTDPEIQKYIDNIKGYEITELLFAIENYESSTGEEIYFNGQLGFSKKSESTPSSSCPANNIPVTHWAGTGNFDIDKCTSILNEISAILTADNAAKIYLIGTFTKAPLSFDLKITTAAKVTASPL